jgi:hypothetical protein
MKHRKLQIAWSVGWGAIAYYHLRWGMKTRARPFSVFLIEYREDNSMRRTSLITIALLCVVNSAAFAAPTLTIKGGRNNFAANPVRIWNVAAAPDLSVANSAGLALEFGFQATGGNILSISAAPNMAAAAAPAPARVVHDNNFGNPIFGWETLTDVDPGDGVNMQAIGIQLGTGANSNEAVAIIGTNIFSNTKPEDLITITTDSSVTSLAWGGRYNADGSLAALTGTLPGFGAIDQGDGTPNSGTNFTSYAGSLAVPIPLTQRFLGDVTDDGRTNSFDVVPFGGILSAAGQTAYKAANPNLNILRGDINNSGAVNNFDVVPFAYVLSSNANVDASAVPEPASITLIGLWLVYFACFPRSRS